ncbi:choline TMA-lyase-activating enzyme [Syntrophotalea acetylenica]|jgi:pyruvate formate lyase activating enzyme|uniref:Choline TMA-lyase-activating enzyme n=1 Tax=Syntrophotalea acetylenica TaxID=29542 RepID=A0A1L3GH84_SYNAC|nr:choline TMA-lyase-activating enzyme [Syntrophotalea acetylenica]APG25301.1 choline TMA-lyase-activating enzyme [Syntrophotalea acetylenica]APG43370.1 choline TMA-lyase-activating enzyme [Syntrophotalea acetylenica]MDY0263054.1 choline TMA-lyase-activating enzyme [Syntrophotalea acetylenica]
MSEQGQLQGMVFDIQKYSMHDGPGVRTLVFLKGCPLRCKWCSNPESLAPGFQVMCLAEQCVSCGRCVEVCPAGVHTLVAVDNGPMQHRIDRQAACTGCGACVASCGARALRVAGREMTVGEVVEVVMEDHFFYMTSGGGVTVGGGEPTMQHDFAGAILRECRRNGVHTAMETCGQAAAEVYRELAGCTDLFLFDLKHIDSERHRAFTGAGNERILANLGMLLDMGANVVVRMPLIAGVNDDVAALSGTLDWLVRAAQGKANLRGVEVLPYHRLGVTKYRQLDMQYPMGEMPAHTPAQLAEVDAILARYDLPVRIVKHG